MVRRVCRLVASAAQALRRAMEKRAPVSSLNAARNLDPRTIVRSDDPFLEVGSRQGFRVSALEVDAYLDSVPALQRQALIDLRGRILDALPEASEGISYRVPAYRFEGAVAAGFASFTNHMSYLPFSGSVLSQLSDEIAAFTHTKSALHFTVDRPLSDDLVKRLVAVRQSEIRQRGR